MRSHWYENELEADCTDFVRRRGGEHRKLDVGPGSKGQLDHAYWMPGGVHFIVEFKRGDETLSPKQINRLNNLSSMGHKVYVVRDYMDFVKIVNALTST